jgi:hypothetical protein
MKQAHRHFIYLNESADGDSGGASGGDAGEKSFSTIAAAVAEMDRREQERKAARKAEKAEKAEAIKAESVKTDDDDIDPDEPEAEPKKKPEAKKPKAKEPEPDPEEDSDDEEQEEPDDSEEDDEPEPKQRDKRKQVATDEADSDDADDSLDEIEYEGKKHRVPKELKDAFMRNADYTQKTQQVAEARKTVESSWREAQQTAQQLAQAQQALTQFAQSVVGSPPDLSLAQQDPQSYLVQKGLYEQRMAQMSQLFEQGHQITQQQQMLQQRAHAEFLREQGEKMLQAMPELRSEKSRAEFRSAAVELGSKYGFSADEVAGIADHRMLLVLRDLAQAQKAAARSTQATASVKSKLANVAPKSAKPGVSGDPANLRDGEAKREFMKSGRTMRDVERYLSRTER